LHLGFQRSLDLKFKQFYFNLNWVSTLKDLTRSLFLANWTLNYNYWTAGTQKGAPGQWSWCSPTKEKNPSAMDSAVVWERGEPANLGGQEDCVHLKVTRDGTGVRVTTKNCSARFIFACQVAL